jgi:Immunity protein family (Imm11)
MGSSLGSEPQLDCSEAFDLSEGYKGLGSGGGALRVASRELLHSDRALARGEVRPAEPIEFVRDEGRTAYDVVGTTYGRPILVSERFLDVLREHRFAGWSTFPVRVLVGDGSELDGYHGLAVTGRAGPIDDSLSAEVILPPPTQRGRARRGLRGACFPAASWDGSDVFACGESSAITVTEAVKRALEEAKATNVAFQRLSEIERTWRADGSLIEDD